LQLARFLANCAVSGLCSDMPRSIPALVNTALLVWARERAGLDLTKAAEKGGVAESILRTWEQGVERPTMSQLRDLGAAYKRPIAVFFLPEPPKDFDPQREFRRLPGLRPQDESMELRLALRLALFQREAAKELHSRLGESVSVFREKAHPNEDPEVVGTRIRKLLGISWQHQIGWAGAYAALNAWRSAVERLGILVFQTGDVELEEMRGTSVAHGPMPVILLNNADAPHGRIFTLIHELVHIMLTHGGHETGTMEGKRAPEEQMLERVSNRFAAATLMPKHELLIEADRCHDVYAGDEGALKKLATRIKVSPEAILRRLLSLHKVSSGIYRRMRKTWQTKPWYSAPQGDGGPSIEVRRLSALGRTFVSLVLEGYSRKAVSSSEVSDYLGLQLKYLDRIQKQLLPGPGEAAAA